MRILMNRVAFLLALLLTACGLDQPIAGSYRAFTESDLDLRLSLAETGAVTFEATAMPADGGENPEQNTVQGTWKREGKVIVITIPGGTIRYRAEKCLSYSSFGQEGCSPGLLPVGSTGTDMAQMKKHPLWRTDTFQKPWPK